MDLVVLGINHTTASAAERERYALSAPRQRALLTAWRLRHPGVEVFLLSTCSRTELYTLDDSAAALAPEFWHALAVAARTDGLASEEDSAEEWTLPSAPSSAARALSDSPANTYAHTGPAALAHLFRVAAGIDSIVLGEPQILSQLREAFEIARECGAVGRVLSELIERALRAGKRARAQTRIGEGNASIASAGLRMAREHCGGDLSGRRVLLVGAGEIGAAAARHLRDDGVGEIIVMTRKRGRAEPLALALGPVARVSLVEHLASALLDADLVVCAAAAENPFVLPGFFAARAGRPIVVLDLAMPRNVDPAARAVPGVTLLDLDAVQAWCMAALEQRAREVAEVERILETELQAFEQWRSTHGALAVVDQIRRQVEAIRLRELRRSSARTAPEVYVRIDEFTRRLTDRYLHNLTVGLRELDPASPADREFLDRLAALALGEKPGPGSVGATPRAVAPPPAADSASRERRGPVAAATTSRPGSRPKRRTPRA